MFFLFGWHVYVYKYWTLDGFGKIYGKHLDVWMLGIFLGYWMVLAFRCGYTSLVFDYPLDPLDGMNAELFYVDHWWYYQYLEPRVNEVKCETYLFVCKQKWTTSTSLVIRLLEDVSRVYGAHLLARIMYNTVQYWYENHPFPTEGRVVTMDTGPFPKNDLFDFGEWRASPKMCIEYQWL